MTTVVFSVTAALDVEQIGDFIADANPARAESFIEELLEHCHQLAIYPHRGADRPDYGQGVRVITHGRYLILYSVVEAHVLIERVIHGSRDVAALLGETD